MNKSFTLLVDKSNNVQKTAYNVVKFNYQNKNYIIYSIDENEEDRQIFVSELISNSEGRYFIEDVNDKAKLSVIVYDIIMEPSKKISPVNEIGSVSENLIDDLLKKHAITLSKEVPSLGVQEYHKDCSIAITKKKVVETATEYYENNLVGEVKKEESVAVPTWAIPTSNAEVPNLEAQPVGVVPSQTPSPEIGSVEPNIEPVVETPSQVNTVNETIALQFNLESGPSPVVKETPQVTTPNYNMNSVPNGNMPYPQMENLAISSDPSLASLGIPTSDKGLGTKPLVKTRKAGFANSKYIIIGTICLVLSVVVVVAAVILIQNK